MKRALYVKFIFAYLIFGFLSFFTIATLTSTLITRHLEQSKAENLYREATMLASDYMGHYYDNDMTLEAIQTQFKSIDVYLQASIWVVDSKGTVLINSASAIDLENPPVIEDFDPTGGAGQLYQTGTFYDLFSEEMLTVIAPIVHQFQTKSYIVIHTPMTNIAAESDQILNIAYITLAIIFLFSLLILGVFTFMVYVPLNKITIAANEYAGGNLKYELPVYADDEIGDLSKTMNYMASELNKSEEYQKKFVANISHDFRSPLTSIKGYVEAIIDGTIPPEMQDKYLKIVLFETERLNKLTKELLTLNDYDTKGTILDISSFDINAVIKRTASAFEGRCTNRRISIELIFVEKTQYVSADMGKIQQVLYNLLDNAIKFSNDDSTIWVETSEKNDKVFVSVKDSGTGIPKESLKKIWERFYKTDPSRGKDKKGTGLGLTITKEIIQSHDENIDVISTPDVGTEFIFTLPKAKAHKGEDE